MNKKLFLFLNFTLYLTLLFANPPNWDENGDGTFDNWNDYQHNGSITCTVSDFLGEEQISEGDMLGAFVNNELRGVANASQLPLDFPVNPGSYLFLMLIYSNLSNETITFRFYDYETDTVYDIYQTYVFIADMTIGDAFSPFIFLVDADFSEEQQCELPENTLHLTSEGEVWYNSNESIGGFQFDVEGATLNNASGGDAEEYGFTVSTGSSTVLGFSFTSSNIPAGCGILTLLSLNGDATGLSNITIANDSGESIDFTYYEQSPDDESENACLLPYNSLFLIDGTVLYNSSNEIGGFQFEVDGANVNEAGGGDAELNSFTVSVGGSTVLGYNFSGSSIPPGCGILTELSLNGEAEELSNITVSSTSGTDLNFVYYHHPLENVNFLELFAISPNITVDSADSTYCDTIYAFARSETGEALSNVPIIFNIDEISQSYGYLSNDYAVTTDSIYSFEYTGDAGATTTLCTYQDLDLLDSISINILASVDFLKMFDSSCKKLRDELLNGFSVTILTSSVPATISKLPILFNCITTTPNFSSFRSTVN